MTIFNNQTKIYKKDIKGLFENLNKLRLDNGFYKASTGSEYNYTWLRDNFYCSIPELWNNPKKYIQTYRTWIDYYKMVERKYNKFSSLILKGRIDHAYEFPNVRLNLDLTETISGWNHVQIDTIGYFLFGIGIGEDANLEIIRDEIDLAIVNKAIKMLDSIQYYNIYECGAWEENNENPRASSIGSIVAGLKLLKKVEERLHIGLEIPEYLITEGEKALNNILPKETPTRDYDLAQLFLIYPFNIVPREMEDTIISNIENHLLKENGVIRYLGDSYFNRDGEAEWSMGIAYLGIIYYKRGDITKAKYMYNKILATSGDYNIPELYYYKTNIKNVNSPLGWSIALTIELAHLLCK